jgi:hypothetical protein
MAAITPNAKNNKREQNLPNKSRNMRKKGLLEFFGDGPHVPALSMEGTLIKAAKKQRDKRANRDTGTKMRESYESDKSTHQKKTRSDDEGSENTKQIL